MEEDRGVTVLSSRIERWQLRRGDHIYAWRKSGGYSYSHHGIYESDEKVIHFTSASSQSSSGSSSSDFPFHNKCREAMRRGGVVVCCLDCFLEGDNLCLFAYSVAQGFSALSNVSVQPTCSAQDAAPPETVLCRANHFLANGFRRYNFVTCNCFHFAYCCKTGREYSSRIGKVCDGAVAINDGISFLLSFPPNKPKGILEPLILSPPNKPNGILKPLILSPPNKPKGILDSLIPSPIEMIVDTLVPPSCTIL